MSATQNKIQELFNKVLQRTVNPRWPGGLGDSDHHLMTMFSIAIQMSKRWNYYRTLIMCYSYVKWPFN